MDISFRQSDFQDYRSQEEDMRNAGELSYMIGYYPERGAGFTPEFGQIEIYLQNLNIVPEEASRQMRNKVISKINDVLGSFTGENVVRMSPVAMNWWQTESWSKDNPVPTIFYMSKQIEERVPDIIDGTTQVFKKAGREKGSAEFTIHAKLRIPKEGG